MNPIYTISGYCFGVVRGDLLYCYSENLPIIILDTLTGHFVREVTSNPFFRLGRDLSLHIDPTGRYISIVNQDWEISPFGGLPHYLYDLIRDTSLSKDYLKKGVEDFVSSPFSPDGQLIAIPLGTDRDEKTKNFGIYNIQSGEEKLCIKADWDWANFFSLRKTKKDHICVFGLDIDPEYSFNILYSSYGEHCYRVIEQSIFSKKSLTEMYCVVGAGEEATVLSRNSVLGTLPDVFYGEGRFNFAFSQSERFLAYRTKTSTEESLEKIVILELPSLETVIELELPKTSDTGLGLIGFSHSDDLLIYSNHKGISAVHWRGVSK
mgnify:FL=1